MFFVCHVLFLLMLAGCADDSASSGSANNNADTGADAAEDVGEDASADAGTDDVGSDADTGCTDGSECESGVCDTATGMCMEAACDDGVQNGDETDTDCGGSCDACADGGACEAAEDCTSGVCDADTSTCSAAACDDGVQNGDETDTDCGGASCDGCADGDVCGTGGDCTSGVCDADTSTCSAAACDDGVQNGDETDVDCGGSCGACENGSSCAAADDCQSQVCDSGSSTCVAAACTDSTLNGDETDVDCGGPDCSSCDDGLDCSANSDCTSSVCDSTTNTCSAAACDDGVQNGDETDTDCGGSTCSACADGASCTAGSDCTSGVCPANTNLCAAPACDDGVQNQDETDIDCGGATCAACTDGDGCAQGSDCTSSVCDSTTNTCAAPACDDGVLNGDETDIDCGGSSCTACSVGETCQNDSDCASTYCLSGSCYMPTSCKDIVDQGFASGDGTYTIDPDGTGQVAPLDAHCDMTSDGGVGYTMVRFDDASLAGNQDAYRAHCASQGMEVIVPRTRDHAESIEAWNGGEMPNLVNVFPKTNGAAGLSNWEGRCQGQSCSFFMNESNSAHCDTSEPNGDNTTAYSLYRYAGVSHCEFGAWNDQGNTVNIGGWVVCSTNDAGPPVYPSCMDYRFTDTVHNASVDGTSGVYTVDPDGQGGNPAFEAHCDMQTAGGGWTMAIKADGTQSTFLYDQAIWTNNSLLSETASALDHTEAKLATFNELPLTQVLIGLETPLGSGDMSLGDLEKTPLVAESTSLFDLLSPGTHVPTNLGRAAWKQTIGGSSLQPNCNREGFNVDPVPNSIYSRARIGIVTNQENDCSSPDSRLGIGTGGTSCGTADDSVGNNARCVSDNGNADIPGFGVVWVRDVPVLESCQALLTAGYDRDGVYAIDPDGQGGQSAYNVYCDQTTNGGGWTLVTINGTDGRPTRWWDNAYPRPGASHYGTIAGAMQDAQAIGAGAATAANYSYNAATLYGISGREVLAYVGGGTNDYITATLPQGCNYFDGSGMCEENSGTYFSVYRSDGTELTANAQACTTANAVSPWQTDPYTEFGLHLLDGADTYTEHCYRTASTLGHQDWGRIYSTFESDPSNLPAYWTSGVHSHWNETGTPDLAGYLMIR